MKVKNTNLLLNENIVIFSRKEQEVLLIDSTNDNNVLKFQGEIICDALNMLKKPVTFNALLLKLQKKHTHAPNTQLEKDLAVFIKKLLSLKIINEMKNEK